MYSDHLPEKQRVHTNNQTAPQGTKVAQQLLHFWENAFNRPCPSQLPRIAKLMVFAACLETFK